MKPVQGEMWEQEYPEWLVILDRLNEVNISDADNNFIKDIEKDYESINIVDEAKKFEYYWSGKRKLKTKNSNTFTCQLRATNVFATNIILGLLLHIRGARFFFKVGLLLYKKQFSASGDWSKFFSASGGAKQQNGNNRT